jgi:uncharacterized protein YjeT (DUF2065 family)
MPGLGDFITGLGIALVLEGVLYALFPEQFRRFMAIISQSPTRHLRVTGLASLAAGVFLVWLVRG